MNLPIPRAVSRKGIAKPAEYTARSRTPRAMVSLRAARMSTALRMGPMQGVQPKEKDQRARDRSEQGAVLQKKGTNGAGGCAKGNENDGESGDECQGRSEKAGARSFSLAKLFHADA